MNKNLPNVIVGIVLGLLIAWLLGLFSPIPTPAAPVPAAKTADAPAPSQPANPAPTTAAVKTISVSPVATPSAPPKVAQAPYQPATMDATQATQIRQQSRVKAMTNNLRQLSTAAQQYMLDKGVTAAGYYDLVGPGTDNYLHNISPVMGEDYSGFYINQSDTQVMIVAPDGTTVTYNQ